MLDTSPLVSGIGCTLMRYSAAVPIKTQIAAITTFRIVSRYGFITTWQLSGATCTAKQQPTVDLLINPACDRPIGSLHRLLTNRVPDMFALR
jgi:hypothetical protein